MGKKKKKVLAVLLILAIATVSVGCSSQNSTANSEKSNNTTSGVSSAADSNTAASKNGTAGKVMTVDEFNTFIKDYVDISHYHDSGSSDTTVSLALEKQYAPKYQTSKDIHLFSDKGFTIDGGTKVKMDMKMSELLDQGWSFANEATKEDVLGANLINLSYFIKKNGKELKVSSVNHEDKEVKYPETCLDSIECPIYSSDYNYAEKSKNAVDFDFDGKINQNSDLKDFISALGEPDSVMYSRHVDENGTAEYSDASILLTYRDSGQGEYDFRLSCDGSKVVSFSVRRQVNG
ncbi:hypothetical protein [uncultured Ruminococcus sp.]|uniref:hypothetical protein n=1 Tax=uncultured Ruminococcus sp. TaxID=165186 RepID=UPI00292EE27F|nr:hypothetical protein [uncultured Ruminococcus sp.]